LKRTLCRYFTHKTMTKLYKETALLETPQIT